MTDIALPVHGSLPVITTAQAAEKTDVTAAATTPSSLWERLAAAISVSHRAAVPF